LLRYQLAVIKHHKFGKVYFLPNAEFRKYLPLTCTVISLLAENVFNGGNVCTLLQWNIRDIKE
jgi:hypothetical protein